jgi:hypothetical protein
VDALRPASHVRTMVEALYQPSVVRRLVRVVAANKQGANKKPNPSGTDQTDFYLKAEVVRGTLQFGRG